MKQPAKQQTIQSTQTIRTSTTDKQHGQSSYHSPHTTIHRNWIVLIIFVFSIFSAFMGVMYAQGKAQVQIDQKNKEIAMIRQSNDKDRFIFNSLVRFNKFNSNYSDQAVFKSACIVWDLSIKYRIPQLKELWHSYLTHEAGYKDIKGKYGERTPYQFRDTTFISFSGEEMTDEKIADLPFCTEVFCKMIALYTYSYFDNTKVALAYNAGAGIFQNFEDIPEIKKIVYDNRGLRYYPECVKVENVNLIYQ